MVLTMVFNMADLGTDVMVILEYSCTIGDGQESQCASEEGNLLSDQAKTDRTQQACEPHWWWFGISGSLLFCANVAQAFCYAFGRPLLIMYVFFFRNQFSCFKGISWFSIKFILCKANECI